MGEASRCSSLLPGPLEEPAIRSCCCGADGWLSSCARNLNSPRALFARVEIGTEAARWLALMIRNCKFMFDRDSLLTNGPLLLAIRLMSARRAGGQQTFEFKTWGGKRKGAGRPPKRDRSSEPHKVRLRFSEPTPVHVTLRVVAPISTLRRPDAYHAVRWSLYAVIGREDFRIVHLSIERDHLHLLVEANDHVALWEGVRAFESSAAQRINRVISLTTGTRRRGQVFADRYHARLIRSPTQARNTLSYVLNNWRRHGLDRGMETMFWDVDYYSSGPCFEGWTELDDSPFLYQTPDYPRLSVCRPKTWLLRTGWRQAGPISMRDVPGPIRSPEGRGSVGWHLPIRRPDAWLARESSKEQRGERWRQVWPAWRVQRVRRGTGRAGAMSAASAA